MVASSIGIASLPLEELSVGTPSHVYRRGSEDTRVEAPTFGHDTIGWPFTSSHPRLLFLGLPLTCFPAAQRGATGVGVTKATSVSGGSTMALALGGPRIAPVLGGPRRLLMRRALRVPRMLVYYAQMTLRSAQGRRLFERRWLALPPRPPWRISSGACL